MSNTPSLEIQLEGLLFTMGTATSYARIAKILGAKKEAVEVAVADLTKHYTETGRGLAVLQQGDSVQLVTSPHVSEIIQQYQKAELEGPLSKAALETLAIIAYKGPITKPEIDTIRGVNSGIMLRTLLVRGLVDRTRSETDARTFSYSLSTDFLRHLGVTSVKDIPGYTDFSENKILEKLAESVRVPVGSENAPDTKKEKISEESMGEAGVSQSDGGTL